MMVRKKQFSNVSDSKLTDCSVLVEILDEVFIPRHEPGFDENWGDRSWHVATVKKDDGFPPADFMENSEGSVLDDSCNLESEISLKQKLRKKRNFECTEPELNKIKEEKIKIEKSSPGKSEHVKERIDGNNFNRSTNTSIISDENSFINQYKRSNVKNTKNKSPSVTVQKQKFNSPGILNKNGSPTNKRKKDSLCETKNNTRSTVGKKLKFDSPVLQTKEYSRCSKDVNESGKNAINERNDNVQNSRTNKLKLELWDCSKVNLNKCSFNISEDFNETKHKRLFPTSNKSKLNSPKTQTKTHVIGDAFDKIDNRSLTSRTKSKPETKQYSCSVVFNVSSSLSNKEGGRLIEYKSRNKGASPKKNMPNHNISSVKKSNVNFNASDGDIDKKKDFASAKRNKSPSSNKSMRELFNLENLSENVNNSHEMNNEKKNEIAIHPTMRKSTSNIKTECVNLDHKNTRNSKEKKNVTAISLTKSKSASPVKSKEVKRLLSNVENNLNETNKGLSDHSLNSGVTKLKKSNLYSSDAYETKFNSRNNRKRAASNGNNEKTLVSHIKKRKVNSQHVMDECENVALKEKNSDNSDQCSLRAPNMVKQQFKALKIKSEKKTNQKNKEGRTPKRSLYPLACKYCNFKCKNDWVMKKHTLVVHNNGNHFRCTVCDYVTPQLGNFQVHQVVHSSHRPFSCKVCDYKAKVKPALVAHSKIHSDLRPFKCDQCECTSKTKQHLKIHKLIHDDVKPIACNLCDYKCKLPSMLTAHNMIHAKDNLFTCDICDFSCKNPYNLKRHKTVHSEAKPFKCGLCHRSFKRKPILKNHMLIHTFVKPYICKDCNFESRDVQGLKKHLMTEHNGFELKLHEK